MTAAWIMNTVGFLTTTVGALLILLYLWKAPQFEDWLTPEGKRAYTKHRRLLIASVALLAAWLMLQYLAIILV